MRAQLSTLVVPDPRGVGGGARATPIISYIRRLRPLFWFNILNFNNFRSFQKNEYFWGMRNCEYFLGVITKLDYFGVSFLNI